MNSTTPVVIGAKGQTVCRPPTWTDVLAFYAFNYGLHVFTMLSAPGSTPLNDLVTAVLALFMPFTGILTALRVIFNRWERGTLDDLHTAHRAGALCMAVLPVDAKNASRLEQHSLGPNRALTAYISSYILDPRATHVHGQYPPTNLPTSPLPDYGNETPPPVLCQLLRVPKTFTISPPRNSGSTPLRLTYNYSILKGVAGIIQVVNGSLGLYRASQRQFSKFGYASYSLTVIPYILMSFLNLLATISEPQYPSMFLVIYRGVEQQSQVPIDISATAPTTGLQSTDGTAPERSEITPSVSSHQSADPAKAADELEAHIIGAVGEAYGDLSTPSAAPAGRTSRWGVSIGGFCCLALTYVIILLLTGFSAGQSTQSQRAWLMSWLVCSQVHGLLFYVDCRGARSGSGWKRLRYSLMAGSTAVGGFVVVAGMIMQDEVCSVI